MFLSRQLLLIVVCGNAIRCDKIKFSVFTTEIATGGVERAYKDMKSLLKFLSASTLFEGCRQNACVYTVCSNADLQN